MAARKSTTTTRKKNIPKIEPKDMCCMKCAHAYLMQSVKANPIIGLCKKNNIRYVAAAPKASDCGFEPLKGEPVIHEMIFLNK